MDGYDDARLTALETRLAYMEKTLTDLDALVLEYGTRTGRLEETVRLLVRKLGEVEAGKDGAMPANVRPPHW